MVQKSRAFSRTCLWLLTPILLGSLLVPLPLTTYAAGLSDSLAVSEEITAQTLEEGLPDPFLTVSDEAFAETLESEPPDPLLTVSDEISAQTKEGVLGELAISDEIKATTAEVSGELTISDEISAMTLDGKVSEIAVSDEISAETKSEPPGGGGGGGGGGGFTRQPQKPGPGECYPYLLEYIKFGRQNNPIEVLKLQIFLRDFEDFTEVPISGDYDRVTYEAVKKFQSRYGQDVLGPWGIDYPTGYVFITTQLAINNIFCARGTANDLDLRNFYPRFKPPAPSGIGGTGVEERATTTPPGPEEGGELFGWRQRLQAAALGFLDWLADLPVYWLALLLLVLIVLAFGGIYWRPLTDRWRQRLEEEEEENIVEEIVLEEPDKDSLEEQPPLTK